MNFLSTSARVSAALLAGLLLTTAAPRCLAIAGDNFADAVELGSTLPAVHVRPADAALTLEAGEEEDVSGSHWLTWVCPATGVYEARGTYPKERTVGLAVVGLDPVVKVYTGDSLSALSPVPHVPLGIVREPKRFRGDAGQRYRFRTGLTPFGGYLVNHSDGISPATIIGFASGDFTFTLTKQADPPSNDDFANAAVVPSGTDVTVTGSNAGASNETGEPLGPYEAGDSVWHRWTAPEAGSYELLLTTPAFVRVTVFSGEILSALTRTQAAQPNYNNPALGTVRLRWQASAGEIRHLRLTGNGYAQQGGYTMRLRRLTSPVNDNLAHAIPVSGALPLTVSGTTADASAEPGVDAGSGSSSSSLWWKWTAAATGWVELSGDAAVGILREGTPLGYTLENSNPLRFRAVAGTVYHLRAATPEAAERLVTITLKSITGLEFSTAEQALDVGSGPSFSTPVIAVPGGLFVTERTGGVEYAALWCRWTAPVSGWVALDTEGSSAPSYLGARLTTEPNTELRPASWYSGYAPGAGMFYNSASRTGNFPFSGIITLSPWSAAARQPLPEALAQDSALAPVVDRLLLRVTAGQSYLFQARPSDIVNSAVTPVKLNLRPAAGPPAVLSARVRELRPATGREAHLLEILVTVTSPNGLVRGTCALAGKTVHFTDTDRTGGDAWAGEYRMVVPVPNAFVSTAPTGVEVTLVDTKGGFYTPSAESPVNVVSQPASLTDLTADSQAPIVEGALPDTAVFTLVNGQFIVSPPEIETIPLHGQPVTKVFRLGIRDYGGSGFAGGDLHIAPDRGVFLPPIRPVAVSFGREQRVSGDEFLGIYEVPFLIPAHAQGRVMCRLKDNAGNVNGQWTANFPWNYNSDLIGFAGGQTWAGGNAPDGLNLGFENGFVVNAVQTYSFTDSVPLPYVLEQKGQADTAAPVISDTAAILDGAGNVRLYARITDDLSGVAGGEVLLTDKYGLVEARGGFSAVQRTGGTALDGRYEILLPAPRHGFGGAHYLSLRADDATGMTAETRLIGPVTLPDRTAEDQRRPRLTRFQLSPAIVNLTAGPAEISVSIGAGDDRPGLTAVCRIFDSAGVLFAEQQVGCHKPVLDCVATITLPARPIIGRSAASRIELELTDSAGRVETYGQAASPAWPDDSSVSLTLGAVSDPFALWTASWPGLPALPPDGARDTDGDGVPDLLEFALGTNPLALPANDIFRTQIPELTVPLNFAVVDPAPGQVSPVIVVHQFSPAPAFSRTGDMFTNGPWKLRIEESTNLLNWTPVPLVDRFADTGVVHTSRTATAQDPRRMFRIIVSP